MDETEVKAPGGVCAAEPRFAPGTILAERFRIIAPLGRGGMGEVYRADDLKLGQQVALKFLTVTGAARLERLYREVRLGRQVSHPNVCRVYDVMEWEGHHFISMEYIDGEDLASLLRRIGKLPYEKALDIARDVCAGLAAAHGLGVVHRDLKPANIMIDGRGTARITDFGLAGLADEPRRNEISGTPGYMAPEQLAGGEVTQKADLYALGLILSEIFTGKQGLSSRDSIDPGMQQLIARCLEPRAESRPASIHSIIASLPAGDALQAAVDAGETPSPEMVAAAGETGELPLSQAWAWFFAAVLLLMINAVFSQRTMLYGRVPFPKKPDVLAERAREVLASAGYARQPVGVAYTFGWNNDFFERGPAKQDLNSVIPSPIVFYYRESPRELLAVADERRVTDIDPPLTLSNMANVHLDASGRLINFVVVPPQVEKSSMPVRSVDWLPFIAQTGIAPRTLQPAVPEWRVPVDSDQKMAWQGVGLRIEAASRNGKPVWFSVIPPWQEQDRTTFAGTPFESRMGAVFQFIVGGWAFAAAVFFARRNLRRSRGDRRGALRLTAFTVILTFCMRLLRVDHVSDLSQEFPLIGQLIGEALRAGVLVFIMYLAVEPYFRRRFPRMLIAWTRLLAGRFRDPMVGRDVLIGAAAGSLCAIASKSAYLFLPPIRTSFTALTEVRHLLFLLLYAIQLALGTGLISAMAFLLLRIVLRSTAAATVLLVPLLTAFMSVNGDAPLAVASDVVAAVIMVLLLRRYGLLSYVALLVFFDIGMFVPMTFDTTAWYFGRFLLVIALAAGLLAYAFRISLASRPLFGLALAEED